ncbi:MAG: GntR family transcriptional regulator, partial [Bdellovibrionota bacterium]
MARSFIDPTSQTPIFQQIIDELERRIITGVIKTDEFLPSVREFAVSNAVNPNTVAKAYQQLQVLGL